MAMGRDLYQYYLMDCRDLLADCSRGELVARSAFVDDGDEAVFALRVSTVRAYTLERLGGLYGLPSEDFATVRAYLFDLMKKSECAALAEVRRLDRRAVIECRY